MLLAVVGGSVGTALTRAAKPPPPGCTLTPQLRDITINQGVGAYSPLVNGKETLVRFYLSMPTCAGSGASIQMTGGTLSVSGGTTSGTVANPTPVPSPTAYPVMASFTAAPMADSTGDPKFVVPPNLVTRTSAFTATFTTTINYRFRATTTATYSAIQPITFTTRPGGGAIQASFAAPSNALGVLFVPMGDAARTYSSQWTTAGQQAVQDGITAAISRQYPLPAGIGNLGSSAGFRYSITPTLLDLGVGGLNLLTAGEFCGTGTNYDLVKAQLAQFLLSHNTVNPNARANRVVGVVDPVVAREPGPGAACFEALTVVNSSEAWAIATPGRAGELVALELAHTFGLTPPTRESPFDGAHSQNTAAENPPLNRRYNLVQRSFLATDKTLLKVSSPPTQDNVNTLLEVPDYSFLHCVFGGPPNTECQTYGPGTVNAGGPPVGSGLSFVMSGTTTGESGIPPTGTGVATGTSVVESYFAPGVNETLASSVSDYHLVQRPSVGGAVLSNLGVPVRFLHSEHGHGTPSAPHASGLFSFALPFNASTNRVELWKGTPSATGSLLLFAQNRTSAPVLDSFSVGSEISLHSAMGSNALALATYSVTNTADSGAGSLRQAILDSNASVGVNDTISFSIGSGQQTISPTSPLPTITDPVTIDGTTQPGFSGSPIIELEGSQAGTPPQGGLDVTAGNSTIKGLVINRWTNAGIRLRSAGNVIEGNYIGTNAAGTAALGNVSGITVQVGPNTIGGTTAATRNVISGNGDPNATETSGIGISISDGDGVRIIGNYIGTNAAGTGALGNNGPGIYTTGSGTIVGGTEPGERNIISANDSPAPSNVGGEGVQLYGPNSVVQGNYIGTDVTGTADLGNGIRGILIATSGNQVGGTTVAARNVISGNTHTGVHIGGGSDNRIEGNYIGTNAAGTVKIGNDGFGIQINSNGNYVGGTAAGAGNLISGNGAGISNGGVVINGGSNVVQGNLIGTDASGTGNIGNTWSGVHILANFGTPESGKQNTIGGSTAGAANVIAFNGGGPFTTPGGGVVIHADAATANPVLQNSIHFNEGLGIDLGTPDVTANDAGDGDTGSNNLQNFPVLTSATGGASTSVSGSLDSAAGTYRIEFFANASCDGTHGEGARFLGAASISPATFTSGGLGASSAGEVVTATATDSAGNTSEFSACQAVSGGGGGGPQNYVVNAENDANDSTCNASHCSLREAINASNASVGVADTITFAVDGFPNIAVGPGGLPTVTDPVTIDATTQDAESTTPDVELDGSGAGEATHGLDVTAGSTTIKGFVIDDFNGDGIHLGGGGGNIIVGNWIGTDTSGNEPSPNAGDGIQMQNSDGNQIGGATAAERNVVAASGGHGIFMFEADGNTVEGNYVGTDVGGLGGEGFGNGIDGIAVDGGSNNDIGPGNVTSGNTNQGVALFSVGSPSQPSNNNSVVGNTIGLDSAGAPLPNGGRGVLVASGTGNTISENSISSNGGLGIDVAGEGTNNNLVAPELQSATLSGGTTTVEGQIDNAPFGDYVVEFFSNASCDPSGDGEGETFLTFAEVTVDDEFESFSAELSGLAVEDIVTATLTSQTTADTSEFSNCETVEDSLPDDQEPYIGRATDTDTPPENLRMDIYLVCPGLPTQVLAVGLAPDSVAGAQATWFGSYDRTLTPANCEAKAVVTDGVTRSNERSDGVTTGPNTLVAAISSPRENATFLQYNLIPFRGLIRSAGDVLANNQHLWHVERDGGGFSRDGTGTIFDMGAGPGAPNAVHPGGWPTGNYTATLTVPSSIPGSDAPSAKATVHFTVLADNDNDGIPAGVDGGCLGGSDNDPLNGDDDKDLDGLPNANDPQPCVPASSYTAIIDFQPKPLPTPSNGNTVTVYVRVPGRNVGQVLSNLVRISRFADQDVSGDNDFKSVAWTVSGGVGTAKFDRQKLIAWLDTRNIDDRFITVTVVGSSGAPAWSFEGSDTVFITD